MGVLKLAPQLFGLIGSINKSPDWWKNTPAWTAILTIAAYFLNNKAGYEVVDKDTMTILLTFILGLISLFTGGQFRAKPAPVITPTEHGQIVETDLMQ